MPRGSPPLMSAQASPAALATTPQLYSCMFCQWRLLLLRFRTHSVYTAATPDRAALRAA